MGGSGLEVVIKFTGDVTGLKSATGQAESAVKGVGKSGKGLGGVFQTVGKTIGKAFTIDKMIKFEKQALLTRAGFEQSMSKVKALSQANAQEFEQLTSKAREMGATTEWTAKDAGDAMGYMSLAGWKTKQMLAGIKPTLDLATASGTDLAMTSEIVTNTMSSFGMKAEEVTKVVDIFAKTQANSGTDVRQMGQAMSFIAPVAHGFGVEIDQTAKYIGILGDNGIKGSRAGTALRMMFSRLAHPTGEATKGIQAFTDATGIQIKQSDTIDNKFKLLAQGWKKLTKDQKAQVAQQIAGTNAMTGFIALMDNYDSGMAKMDKVMADNTITAKSQADVFRDNLAGALKSVSSAWEALQLSFTKGQSALIKDLLYGVADVIRRIANEFEYVGKCMDKAYNEIIIPTLDWFKKKLDDCKPALQPITDFFSKTIGLSPKFQLVIGLAGLALVGFVIFVIPVIKAFKLLRKSGLLVLDLFGHLKKVGGFLATVFGIIGWKGLLIALAIAGIILVGYELYKHWDELSALASEVWGNIKKKVNDFWEDYQNKPSIGQEFAESIANDWQYLKDTAESTWSKIKTAVEEAWKSYQDKPSLFNQFCTSVGKDWDNLKQKVIDFFNEYKSQASIGEQAIESWRQTWSRVKTKVCGYVDTLKEKIKNMFNVEIKTPHIPLPHVNVTGSFGLNPPSVPKFEWGGWYAKGAIFNKPTVLGSRGVGDAVEGHGSNPEAVLPIDELPNLLGINNIHSTLEELKRSRQDVYFVVDGRTLAKGTYDRFDSEGGNRINLSRRGIR